MNLAHVPLTMHTCNQQVKVTQKQNKGLFIHSAKNTKAHKARSKNKDFFVPCPYLILTISLQALVPFIQPSYFHV